MRVAGHGVSQLGGKLPPDPDGGQVDLLQTDRLAGHSDDPVADVARELGTVAGTLELVEPRVVLQSGHDAHEVSVVQVFKVLQAHLVRVVATVQPGFIFCASFGFQASFAFGGPLLFINTSTNAKEN